MTSLMTRSRPRRALPLTLASVLALSLVPCLPASPAAAGERGARCQAAALDVWLMYQELNNMERFSGNPEYDRPERHRGANAAIQRSVRTLRETVKASENLALVSQIGTVSQRTVSEGWPRNLLRALEDRIRDLDRNIHTRREFDVTFVDDSGQVVTKKVAC
jgi:hypothetical protein